MELQPQVLISEAEIAQRINELGKQISNDYRQKKLTIICILKGAIVFIADLLRKIDLDIDLQFIHTASYYDKTYSSGEVKFVNEFFTEIEGKDILIVDDILDSGLTLYQIREKILSMNPSSLRICVLLNKQSRRIKDVEADYVGFNIPNEFVVGYGMDYNGRYRGLSHISIIKR